MSAGSVTCHISVHEISISKDDVMRYAPFLANRAALNTSLSSADDIVTELVKLRDRYRAVAMVPDEIEDPS